MNWGKGIAIGMVLFMGFIITLVVIMMHQNIDLVQEDYYQRELNYNQQYDAEKVYAEVSDSISISLVNSSISIKLGKIFQNDSVLVELKRPNDQKQDLSFRLNAQPEINLPINKLSKGQFECQVSGKIEGKTYFHKKNLYLE